MPESKPRITHYNKDEGKIWVDYPFLDVGDKILSTKKVNIELSMTPEQAHRLAHLLGLDSEVEDNPDES